MALALYRGVTNALSPAVPALLRLRARRGKEDAARRVMEMGFTHLIFGLPPAKADKVLPLLDQYAALAEKLRH